MKKKLNQKLWEDFISMLKKPYTLNNYYNYYYSMVSWIKVNIKYFDKIELKQNRLDVLIELKPEKYIIDSPEITLSKELNRIEKNKPKTNNIFAMIIGDTLWELVTIKSGIDCPKCKHDELKYEIVEILETKNKKMILECDSCAWIQNIDNSIFDEEIERVIPASKEDLKKIGIIL